MAHIGTLHSAFNSTSCFLKLVKIKDFNSEWIILILLIYLCAFCYIQHACSCFWRPEEGLRFPEPVVKQAVITGLMMVLGIELRSFERATRALNDWVICPAPGMNFIYFTNYSEGNGHRHEWALNNVSSRSSKNNNETELHWITGEIELLIMFLFLCLNLHFKKCYFSFS